MSLSDELFPLAQYLVSLFLMVSVFPEARLYGQREISRKRSAKTSELTKDN